MWNYYFCPISKLYGIIIPALKVSLDYTVIKHTIQSRLTFRAEIMVPHFALQNEELKWFHNLQGEMWNHYPCPKSESRLYCHQAYHIVQTHFQGRDNGSTFCFVECGIEMVPQFIERNVESFITALKLSLDYADSMHPKYHGLMGRHK